MFVPEQLSDMWIIMISKRNEENLKTKNYNTNQVFRVTIQVRYK